MRDLIVGSVFIGMFTFPIFLIIMIVALFCYL